MGILSDGFTSSQIYPSYVPEVKVSAFDANTGKQNWKVGFTTGQVVTVSADRVKASMLQNQVWLLAYVEDTLVGEFWGPSYWTKVQ